MNVLTEMVKPIFSRDWDLEKCPEESLVFFFWNLLIFELEAILGLSMSNQKSNTIQKRETFETQTPKNYQYLSEKKPLQSYLEIFVPRPIISPNFQQKRPVGHGKRWKNWWPWPWNLGFSVDGVNVKTQKHVAENARTQKFWGFCWDSFILFPWHSLRFSIRKNAQRYWHASRHKRSGSGWHTALLSTAPLKQSQTDLWYRAKTYFLLAEMLSKGPNASKVAWQM